MKVKIIPAEDLSTKTLIAEDYVRTPVIVTITEEVQTDYRIHLDVETSDQAQSMLEEMDDVLAFLTEQGAKKKDVRITERWVSSAVVEDK